MKPFKIIELSGFNRNKIAFHPEIGSDEYYVASWAGLFARRFANKFSDINVECWRAEPEYKRKIEKSLFGMKGVIFPYKKPITKNVLTFEMIKILKQYEKKFRLIIHYHSIFDLTSILLPFFFKDSSIVLTHHGDGRNRISSNSLKSKLIKILIKKSYKRIWAITYLRREVNDFILKLIPEYKNLYFMPVGSDFNILTPEDKIKARKKIGINPEKIYGIYVGNFYKLKGVDLILKIYERLKIRYNFSVIFVGGNENNELFIKVKNSGCPYFGYQKWTEMKWFYSAADFYIHPAFNKHFMGMDVSWMEALACNIPVLSPQLGELDFDYTELGIYVDSINGFENETKFMINNHENFKKCRESSIGYLDANNAIMEKLYRIIIKEK